MARLTEKRRDALRQIADVPGKSGDFWRSLGVSAQTLIAAELDGLLEGRGASFFDDGALRRRWFITDAGRAALEADHAG